MASPRQSKAEAALGQERAEKATRVAAMLDRWAAEDVSDEPDWDVDNIQSVVLHGSGPVVDKPTR